MARIPRRARARSRDWDTGTHMHTPLAPHNFSRSEEKRGWVEPQSMKTREHPRSLSQLTLGRFLGASLRATQVRNNTLAREAASASSPLSKNLSPQARANHQAPLSPPSLSLSLSAPVPAPLHSLTPFSSVALLLALSCRGIRGGRLEFASALRSGSRRCCASSRLFAPKPHAAPYRAAAEGKRGGESREGGREGGVVPPTCRLPSANWRANCLALRQRPPLLTLVRSWKEEAVRATASQSPAAVAAATAASQTPQSPTQSCGLILSEHAATAAAAEEPSPGLSPG